MVLETLKEKIRSIKEEYEEFYGLLAWQPEKDEKELGFLVRACFDESIQIKKMDKGVSANITLFMVLMVALLKEEDAMKKLEDYYLALKYFKGGKPNFMAG